MASHQFAVEKAKFSASLLKPDVTTISRDQVSTFLGLLDRTVSRCSPSNIQSCKAWLLNDIVPSSTRVGVLGRYLIALSRAQANVDNEVAENGAISRMAFRRRLHILYLLNDVLHHTKYHADDHSQFSILSGFIQPYLVDLVQLTSSGNRPRISTRLQALLHVWEDDGYYGKDYVDKLRDTALNSAKDSAQDMSLNNGAPSGELWHTKEQPYVMPASHGDPSTAFYDLPAGNLMRHIMPNRSIPIQPDEVRPLQFVAGPADENLVIAVQDFMTAVSEIDSGAVKVQGEDDMVEDIDELGQVLFRDETGELLAGRTYYGWSREFCDKMKNRGRSQDKRPIRNGSYSTSRSRSQSPRKRRRYSDSISGRSASFGRSRSRSRSRSRLYSPQPNFRNNGNRQGNNKQRDTPSRSRARSRSQSRSPSYQPAPPRSPAGIIPNYQPQSQHTQRPSYPVPPSILPVPPSSTSPPNMAFNQLPFPPPPLGPGGIPIPPPPPPPNYTGPWPPPPPPPPPLVPGTTFNHALPAGGHAFQPPMPGFAGSPGQQGRQYAYGSGGPGGWQG